MDVISFYSTKRGKISLTKRRLLLIGVYIVILVPWIWFCAVKIPEYQEQQRNKVCEREREIIKQIEKERMPVYYAENTMVNVYNSLIGYMPDNLLDNYTTVVETTAPETEEPSYTAKDIDLLARLIHSEGGIESYQCKLYIGSVVLNRMASDDFPDTLYDVIYQKDNNATQFSVTICTNGIAPIDEEPSEEAIKAATELLTNGTQLPAEVLIFYADYCTGWVTTRCKYTKIDHTVFAYIYEQ